MARAYKIWHFSVREAAAASLTKLYVQSLSESSRLKKSIEETTLISTAAVNHSQCPRLHGAQPKLGSGRPQLRLVRRPFFLRTAARGA